MQSALCWLCIIAPEARGESTDSLAAETHGHINSTGCEGMATTVTAAHREEFLRIYSKEELAEKAQDIEVTIPVKKSQETRYNLDPGSCFINCF